MRLARFLHIDGKNYLKDNLRMVWECHTDGNYYMVLKVAGEKICQLNFGEGY